MNIFFYNMMFTLTSYYLEARLVLILFSVSSKFHLNLLFNINVSEISRDKIYYKKYKTII